MGAAAIIGEIAKERDISLKELSRRVDIPYTTLYNAVKRDSKMDFETVQKIADALGVLWYNLYPTNHAVHAESYDERLASACEWLEIEQGSQEIESGADWDVKQKNNWLNEHFEEAARLYDVKKSDLLEVTPRYGETTAEELEKLGLHPVDLFVSDKKLIEHIKKIAWDFGKLNEEGQAEAIERVHELTQLPKYKIGPSSDDE